MCMSNVCKDNRYHKMVFIVIMKTKEEAFKLCNNFYETHSQTFSLSHSLARNMLKFSKKTLWSNDVQSKHSSFSHLYFLTFFCCTWHFCSSFVLSFSLPLLCMSLLYKYRCNKIINTKNLIFEYWIFRVNVSRLLWNCVEKSI